MKRWTSTWTAMLVVGSSPGIGLAQTYRQRLVRDFSAPRRTSPHRHTAEHLQR